MSDEIKEIINYFKDDIEYLEKEFKNTNFLGRYITIRDKECDYLKKLLDYITNLQQENKQLKEEKRKAIECIHKMQHNFKQEEHIGSAYDDDMFYEDLLEILGDKENE